MKRILITLLLLTSGCAVGFYARIGDQHIDLSNISAESATEASVSINPSSVDLEVGVK